MHKMLFCLSFCWILAFVFNLFFLFLFTFLFCILHHNNGFYNFFFLDLIFVFHILSCFRFSWNISFERALFFFFLDEKLWLEHWGKCFFLSFTRIYINPVLFPTLTPKKDFLPCWVLRTFLSFLPIFGLLSFFFVSVSNPEAYLSSVCLTSHLPSLHRSREMNLITV